jgi:predicted Zn-dependent peptidase
LSSNRFDRTEVGGGLSVLTQKVSGVRSASVGIWVRSGSAHEAPDELGAAHLLEHMVFKGTDRRSAKDIALALERVGGSLDAYTTREHTSYQARVLDDDLPTALDVLSDFVAPSPAAGGGSGPGAGGRAGGDLHGRGYAG